MIKFALYAKSTKKTAPYGAVRDFIKLVLDDVTVSGSIPISLSEAEIERLINKELPWLYQEWNQAFQETWTIMSPAAFKTPEFKAARAIQLPPCVLGIKELVYNCLNTAQTTRSYTIKATASNQVAHCKKHVSAKSRRAVGTSPTIPRLPSTKQCRRSNSPSCLTAP